MTKDDFLAHCGVEEMEGRIALAQVAVDKSDSCITDKEQKCRNERLNNKEIEESVQQRSTKIKGAMRASLESDQRSRHCKSSNKTSKHQRASQVQASKNQRDPDVRTDQKAREHSGRTRKRNTPSQAQTNNQTTRT